MKRRGRIVLAGSVAQKPFRGGHTWVLLQWMLGLRRLGWEVTLLDRLDPSMSAGADGPRSRPLRSVQVRYFRDVLERFGLGGSYSLAIEENGDGRRPRRELGLDRREVLRQVTEAALLVNVMGFLEDPEILGAARRRVFLDIDPGFGQMWRQLGLADVLAGHDDYVTIGRNLGKPGCTIPDCGLAWIPIDPPIVLEHWPRIAACEGPFTSIASWRGRYGPVEYGGERYGLRVHGFRKLAPLPRRTGAAFELALDIDAADGRDLAMLAENGWNLVDPLTVAADPWAYRDYIARSGAELMVAKDAYVRSRSGWFSDRSVCYLASGRPVIAEDTGLEGNYPTGEGLLVFRTLDEASAAVEEVARDRQRHCHAARRLAEACFDSDRVLGGLIDRLGVAA